HHVVTHVVRGGHGLHPIDENLNRARGFATRVDPIPYPEVQCVGLTHFCGDCLNHSPAAQTRSASVGEIQVLMASLRRKPRKVVVERDSSWLADDSPLGKGGTVAKI